MFYYLPYVDVISLKYNVPTIIKKCLYIYIILFLSITNYSLEIVCLLKIVSK